MADFIAYIGTASRTHSDLDAWEASGYEDDTASTPGSTDTAIAEMYDDDPFGTDTIGTTGPAALIIRPVSGHAHAGVSGAGVRYVNGGSGACLNISIGNQAADPDITVEDLEFDGNNADHSAALVIQYMGGSVVKWFRNIVHGTAGGGGHIGFSCPGSGDGGELWLANNIVYHLHKTSGSGSANVVAYTIGPTNLDNYGPIYFNNNFCHNIRNDGGTGSEIGLAITFVNASAGDTKFFNNWFNQYGGTSTNSGGAFQISGINSADRDTNASSDTSAPGTTTYHSIVPGDELTDVGEGSEDYTFKSGNTLGDVGTDQGTSYGNEIDITGRNRDTEGDDWSIHAYQEVVAGGTPYDMDIDETFSITDAPAPLAVLLTTISESLTVTDAPVNQRAANLLVQETLTVTESPVALAVFDLQLSETLTVTESSTVLAVFDLQVAETFITTETPDPLATFIITVAETLTVTDTTEGDIDNPDVDLNESITFVDSVDVQRVSPLSISEAIALAEAISNMRTANLTIAETLSITETVTNQRQSSLTLSETLGLAETEANQRVSMLTIAETTAFSDTVLVITPGDDTSVTETLSITDSVEVLRNSNLSLSEGFSLADTVDREKHVYLTVAESLSVASATSVNAAFHPVVTENLNVANQVLTVATLQAAITETFAVVDASATTATLYATLSEAALFEEQLLVSMNLVYVSGRRYRISGTTRTRSRLSGTSATRIRLNGDT